MDKIIQNLDVISELKKNGASDLQIFKHIGVSPATFYKHLNDNPKLQEVWNDAKADLVTKLEGELYRKAMPHTLTTTKTFEKNGEVTTEITVKEVDGDLGALIFLLKNLSDKWVNEPQMLKLKEKELELKEEALRNNLW